jgi:integral membrane protein
MGSGPPERRSEASREDKRPSWVGSALTRFRVMAYVVGVLLIILAFVAMPLKYVAHEPILVTIVGQIHGLMYMVYLVVSFHLAVLQRWPLSRTVLILLAGTVPVMSFVAERWVTRHVRAREAVNA